MLIIFQHCFHFTLKITEGYYNIPQMSTCYLCLKRNDNKWVFNEHLKYVIHYVVCFWKIVVI